MVWYDAPMSRSGELAAATRRISASLSVNRRCPGRAGPRKAASEISGVIGSSDTYLIDRSEQVIDVAGEIIRQLPQVQIIALAGETVAAP